MSSTSGSPKGYTELTRQNYTPEQTKLFGELFAHLNADSPTARMASGDQAAFDEIEAPAKRQFGELQGDIASRFSGQGMGARRGSGSNIAQNTAASNFAQDLQANRQKLMRQATQDLMGNASMLLGQRPFETEFQKDEEGGSTSDFIFKLMKILGPIAGVGIGGAVGGVPGAMAGGKIGQTVTSGF